MHTLLNVARGELSALTRGGPPATEGGDCASGAELRLRLDRIVRRITVRGELDMDGVGVLGAAMATVIDVDPGDTCIDLVDVSFIDAAGLSCLATFADQLADIGAKLCVTGASARLRRVFDIARLDGLLQAS